MIKISRMYNNEIVESYYEKMLKIIKKNYRGNGLSREIKKYFEENGIFSDKKVIGLLSDRLTPDRVRSFPTISKKQKEKLFTFYSYRLLPADVRHKLLVSLGVQVCPYCNRQYITTWKDGTKDKTTADLDHFYPKKSYPLLALSLYNFIPSCQICNSRMKQDRTEEIIYPYEERFGDEAVFEAKSKRDDYSNQLHALLGMRDSEMEIKLKVSNLDDNRKTRIENSISVFHLNEVYQSHIGYVNELLIKKRVYNDGTYLQMMREQFSGILGKYGASLEDYDLEWFMYGFCWKDGEDPDRPLSKLTYDIVKR